MHRFVLHNDEIREASQRVMSPGQIGLLAGWGVFSTLRVIDGVLFAYERHWSRMKRDAALMRVPFPADPEHVRNRLLALVKANLAQDATLRVVVVRNRGGMWESPGNDRDYDLIALTTELKDWGTSVKLAVAPQARHAACVFAGTKILSWAMNLTWLEEAQSRGFDEVILLNERGEVSECTSANIFIAEGNRVWTPPLRSGCLPGVTRELLLSEIRADEIEIGERDLYLPDLEKADEVFITSTTRELLPVLAIEGQQIRQSGFARAALAAAFSNYVQAYVTEHRAATSQPTAGNPATDSKPVHRSQRFEKRAGSALTHGCPNCGSRNLRLSHARTASERFWSLFGIRPLRCRDCRLRFIDHTWRLSDLRYARCPKCFRMDLALWSERHYRVPASMIIGMRLGGNPYRCEYCRYNFVSFRTRKEKFTFARWKKKQNPEEQQPEPAPSSVEPSPNSKTTAS